MKATDEQMSLVESNIAQGKYRTELDIAQDAILTELRERRRILATLQPTAPDLAEARARLMSIRGEFMETVEAGHPVHAERRKKDIKAIDIILAAARPNDAGEELFAPPDPTVEYRDGDIDKFFGCMAEQPTASSGDGHQDD